MRINVVGKIIYKFYCNLSMITFSKCFLFFNCIEIVDKMTRNGVRKVKWVCEKREIKHTRYKLWCTGGMKIEMGQG
jgi:hypothetical protein